MDVRVASDGPAAARDAAHWCASRLSTAVRDRGSATFAVSGGDTPNLMFDELAGLDLPWDAISVLQVDERVAPDGHRDRNLNALIEHLLDPASVPEQRRLPMPVTADDLEAAAADYGRLVASLGPLDVVHLGLGDDGHTASWPPGDPVVDVSDPVALSGVYRGRRRMTLTPVAVAGARWRAVLVTGASKADAVARWLAGDESVPAHRIAREHTAVFLDQAVAPAR